MAQEQQLKKVAEGREAEMFEWEDGKILRLLRGGFGEGGLDNEVRALRTAEACGLPVPAVGERVIVEGRHGVVMERIDGTDLLTTMGRTPLSVFKAGRICGELHARMHTSNGSSDLPALKDRLDRQIDSPLVPTDLASLARERLTVLPDGNTLCHGDYHPGNVIVGSKGPMVIDWPGAARGEPEADVARTLLLLGAGEPATYTLLLRLLTKVGRGLFIWLYLRSYRRVRPLDMARVREWQLPVTIARLAEDIEHERTRLLRRIDDLRRSHIRSRCM